MDLTDLLNEWFTGRDADGNESSLYASRWKDNQNHRSLVRRIYTPHMVDLEQRIRSQTGAYRIGASIVNGADDRDDIRVEIQHHGSVENARLRRAQVHVDGATALISDAREINPADFDPPVVTRWRSPLGSFDRVVENHGGERARRPNPGRVALLAQGIDVAAGLSSDTRNDLATKENILRTHRTLLRQKIEAVEGASGDTAPVSADIAAVELKLAAIAAEKETRKVASRSERLTLAAASAAISNEEKYAQRAAETADAEAELAEVEALP